MTTEEKSADLQRIGKCAHDSLAEMVAALECDYERLEELRDERDGYDWEPDAAQTDGPGTQAEAWADENPDEAQELKDLEAAAQLDGYPLADADAARERIQEDALSVQVRYGWINPGATDDMLSDGPEEYEILLSTGGPATRIVGKLGAHGEPESARLEAQDWFTPWTPYADANEAMLLAYARCFYFGE